MAGDLIEFARQSFNESIKTETIKRAFEIIGDAEIVLHFLQMAFPDYYIEQDNPDYSNGSTPNPEMPSEYEIKPEQNL